MAAVEPGSGGDANLTKKMADAIIQDRAAQKAEEIEGRPAASSPIHKRGRPPAKKFNPRRLPDRWEEYSPYGKVIADTRLIAFKTPLKPDFFQGTELEPFGIEDLVEAMEKQNKKLGLVIDLTATTRYYNPAELEQYGIKYKKIFCPGRDFDALKDLGDEFMDTIKEYFMENLHDDSLIGVHCTHGLNRTGYLVCRYMHECLGWSVDESVQTFNAARGHEIERKEYITALQLKCEYHNGSYRC